MAEKRKLKMLLGVACLAGFVFGLFNGMDDRIGRTSDQCRIDAILCFSFIVGLCCLAALVEKGMVRIFSTVRRVADARASRLGPRASGWSFIKYFGWVIFSTGGGIATSSLWLGSLAAWQGFDVMFGGLGGVLGSWLAKRILGAVERTRT